MGTVELLALSLGLSVAVAAVGLAGGMMVERLSADPGLRDRVWGAALLSPLLPPAATALLLMTPPPVREIVSPSITTTVAVSPSIPALVEPVALSGPTLDASLIAIAVIASAGLLAVVRVGILMLRARRLAALVRTGEAADAATLETVRDVARGLAITPPPVVVSAATSEPLLAGLRSARLVLPKASAAGDPDVARAVIAHELVHLKRGDHRALWVEELALTVLAANPLMPLLRARRSAAREEACDAVALADAAPETRRAYAQTLIEALRNRAGPRAPGLMPALTFTGAGRTTAMHRLKAVLTPAAPAGRKPRLLAVGVGALALAAASAGSVAIAAQREPTLRTLEQEGRPAPGPRTRAPDGSPAAVAATDAARNALSPEQRERYQRVSAQGYRDLCASDDPADGGFCAGVLLAQMQNAGVCPTGEAATDTRAGVGAYVDRGREAVRRLSPRRDEGAHEYAGRAMAEAFPCTTSTSTTRAETGQVVVWMPVDFEGGPILRQGDMMHVTLTDAAGTLLAETSATGAADSRPADIRIPLTKAQFPGLGQGNRAYTLTGEIRRADGSVERAVEPVTVRLGPGSERTARNLRPSLAFQPMPRAARTAPSAARPAEIASLRFDVTAAGPILAKDGDVLKVWIDGPFEAGARTTRTLSVPLAGGPFQPVSTHVDVAAPAQGQGADFVYRAEIIDRDGRKTHETHSPALLTVRGRSAVATPRLMPVG